ncbi:MAG: hypothetical protein LN414_05295, partial [Candidatus Thermoplasmatota archaeon]|nr:hypothetical protein [Candidatus Thermoplasmatota archaeon]
MTSLSALGASGNPGDIDPLQCLAVDDNKDVHDMAVEGEKVYVVADDLSYRGAPNGIYLKYFDGEIWHDWIRVNDDPDYIGRGPRVDAKDGKAHIVWDAKRPSSSYNVHYRTFENGTWGPITNVIPHDNLYWKPQQWCDIAADGNDIAVTWIARYDYRSHLYCRFKRGSDWGSATHLETVELENHSLSQARIVISGLRVHVVWQEGIPLQQDIFIRTFDGTEWQPKLRLNENRDGGNGYSSPTINIDGENVHIAWTQHRVYDEISTWYMYLPGGEPGIPIVIEDDLMSEPRNPSIAADEGRVLITWNGDLEDPKEVFFVYRNGPD